FRSVSGNPQSGLEEVAAGLGDPAHPLDAVLGSLRTAGKHHSALDRALDRSPAGPSVLAWRSSSDLVPGHQSSDDLRFHAAFDRVLGAMGAVWARAIDDRKNVTWLHFACSGLFGDGCRRVVWRALFSELALAPAL